MTGMLSLDLNVCNTEETWCMHSVAASNTTTTSLFHKRGVLVVYTETQGWLLRFVHFGTCSQKIVFYSFLGPIPWNIFVDTPKLISVWKGPSNICLKCLKCLGCVHTWTSTDHLWQKLLPELKRTEVLQASTGSVLSMFNFALFHFWLDRWNSSETHYHEALF